MMVLAVFPCRLNLLNNTAILFFTARITAVSDDMTPRRQRTIVPNEVKIAILSHKASLQRTDSSFSCEQMA
jgi:hypothetical protein